jgi:predicted dehydrogenase/threonine dehydrogenase-like Zn-dependent dehydrogenase
MFQITDNYWTGEVTLEEVCAPTVRPGTVLVRTAYSLISAGTERMKLEQSRMSLVGKARARPDQVARVLETLTHEGVAATYRKLMNRLKTPVPLGYSLAGKVVAVAEGVTEFREGDHVACAGASANHAEFNLVPKNLCVHVPDELPLDLAACGTIGAIALQGVRQANSQLGELAVVIGLGLVGQFCVQVLVASGCKVLGIDLESSRLELAKTSGATGVSLPDKQAARWRVEELSRGIGADVVLLTASSATPEPVQLAAALARDRARIVDIGKTRLDLPWEAFYEKELDFRMSRSYGPGRYDPNYEEQGADYPVGYVRWTEKRNIEFFLELVAQGKVRPQSIINQRFAIADAEKAYQALLEDKSALGILLEYPTVESKPQRCLELRSSPRPAIQQIGIGVIGAGNFCKSMILPSLRREPNVTMVGICAATGLSSTDSGKRFGFEYATTDASEVLNDSRINAVIIATRHDLHAPLTQAALNAGKSVFVEKPLSIKEEDLEELQKICEQNSSLMVDYNRRFAPHVVELARWMHSQPGPWIATYRVNAGALPLNHWHYDTRQGGGRLLGEGCHFVDLLMFLFRSHPVSVRAQSAGGKSTSGPAEDNAVYTLRFASGSVAQIIYSTEGDPSVPKERLEVIGNNAVATLENYRRLQIAQSGRKRTWRTLVPDKGHRASLQGFLNAVGSGTPMPIPLADLFTVSHVCFLLSHSLQ